MLTVAQLGLFKEGITAGRGWIAVALVIFARWRPGRALAGALAVRLRHALQFRLQAWTCPGCPTRRSWRCPTSLTLLALLRSRVEGRAPRRSARPTRKADAGPHERPRGLQPSFGLDPARQLVRSPEWQSSACRQAQPPTRHGESAGVSAPVSGSGVVAEAAVIRGRAGTRTGCPPRRPPPGSCPAAAAPASAGTAPRPPPRSPPCRACCGRPAPPARRPRPPPRSAAATAGTVRRLPAPAQRRRRPALVRRRLAADLEGEAVDLDLFGRRLTAGSEAASSTTRSPMAAGAAPAGAVAWSRSAASGRMDLLDQRVRCHAFGEPPRTKNQTSNMQSAAASSLRTATVPPRPAAARRPRAGG